MVQLGRKAARNGLLFFACFFVLILCLVKNVEAATGLSAKLNSTETTCTIQMTDYKMPTDGRKITVAVWSAKGGQNDIRWRTLTANSSGYACSFSVSEHGDSGKYYAHAYLQSQNGSMTFLKDATFEVQAASAEAVTVINMNQTAGTCQVKITGITSPSGVTSVKVPVWSKSNQSDIVWYSATKKSDGSWLANVDFSKHGGATGTYHVHVYAISNNRSTDFVGNTKAVYSKGEPEATAVTATLNSPDCSLKATGLQAYGEISTVYFVVWSNTDGQDDIRWVKADYNSATGIATKNISLNDYCDYGVYSVHVYTSDSSGKKTFRGNTKFELPYPSIDSVKTEVNGKEFQIKISGINCVGGIDRITVPVWSKSDQSDIVWYSASKQSDGSYLIQSDISRHKNNTGTFHVHVYVYDGRDSYGHCAATSSFVIGNSAGELKVEGNADKSVYTATISNLSLVSNYASLVLPVWSDHNGQDDIHWYETSLTGTSCQITIPMSNHGDDGIYHLHLYGKTSTGALELINAYKFEISRTNVILFENQTEHSVDVRIKLSADITAAKVQFPTWCANDQSDIKWYTASKQSDGSYKATIDVANHQNHSGTYKVHAYYFDNSGAPHYINGSAIELSYSADGQATITSCMITGGNNVTVTASVTAYGTYGLFRLAPGATSINASDTPLATVNGSGTITLTTPLNANTSSSLINEKLVVAQKRGAGYVLVSNGYYITNPEAAATNTRAFPTVATKKGLQVNTTMADDAADLGVNHAVVNVVLNNIPSTGGTYSIPYNYNGKTWYMDMAYIYALDKVFSEQASNGSIVSAVLLMQWDSQWSNLIIASGRTSGHSFYGLNAETQDAREQLAAIFSFLSERYSDASYNVVNWILGNEVDDYTDYNWAGNIGLQQYSAYYAHAFRLLYNSVKSKYSNARVYISLDHVWNYPRSYGFKAKDLFEAFVSELQSEGDINWNIAFHPYPSPITSANFWKNKTGVTNSSNSSIFTMLNLRYLTDYIKNTYGSQHRFILSETGFTSWSGGVTDEKLQAAAIAYGYYLAEFNDMVDSFVVHRHVDNRGETSEGLYLGLWNSNPAYDEYATTKKFSWTVFKYMDTSKGASYTNFALSIIGADSWSSIVPGYSAARFN